MSVFEDYPVIDPRNEATLREQAKVSMINRSQGSLNDTTIHGAADVFAGSLSFCFAEGLFYANQLVKAFALSFFENTGEVRELGTKAVVDITFTLSAPRSLPYFIEPNTEAIGYDIRGNAYSYFINADQGPGKELVIPPNQRSATFTATAEETGEEYNLPQGSIKQLVQPLAFIQSVANGSPAKGGTRPETDEEFLARAIKALRRRNLTADLDFEEEAEKILSKNSYAKAIGRLNGDKNAYIEGAVHVFLLNRDGQPATQAQLNTVYQAMLPKLQLGVTLFISPMEQLNVEGSIVAKLQPQTNPDTVAKSLWQTFQYLLSPRFLEAGQSLLIDEIKYNLRSVRGIKYLDRLELNKDTLNVPMPNAYTIAKANVLEISLVTAEDTIFEYAFASPPIV